YRDPRNVRNLQRPEFRLSRPHLLVLGLRRRVHQHLPEPVAPVYQFRVVHHQSFRNQCAGNHMAEQDRIHHHIMKPRAFSGRILSFFSEADADTTPEDSRSDIPVSPSDTAYGNPPQMSSGPETGAAQRPPDSGSPASRIQKFMQYFTEPEPEPETGTGVTPEPAGKLTSFFTEPDSDEIPAGVTRETHAPLQASTETHLDPASQPEPVPPGADAGQPADGKAVTPSFVQRIRSLFVSPVQKDIQTLDFDPGELGTPSLEGSLRDVNITYPIDPPYQFI